MRRWRPIGYARRMAKFTIVPGNPGYWIEQTADAGGRERMAHFKKEQDALDRLHELQRIENTSASTQLDFVPSRKPRLW